MGWAYEVEQHYASYEGMFTNTVRLYRHEADAVAMTEYLNAWRDETWAAYLKSGSDYGYLKRAVRKLVETTFPSVLGDNFDVQDWGETTWRVVGHNVIE